MAPLDVSISKKLKIRRLEANDVTSFRELRLEGLKQHPEAFGASWEDEASKPPSWWAERLEMTTVLGGWIDNSALLGLAGFYTHGAVKLRHKGVLWGMYVRPEARGTGLAASLVRKIIEHGQGVVEEISLTVVASNAAACRLYAAAGFEQYGLERRALKVGDTYYDEVLMALQLRQPREAAIRD
jgi:ribosomal protein S18 acetylase RimI-like enzyme